jgi:putative phage-type endonuclease
VKPERTKLVQRSPEWHAWRRTGIGSSDIPVITGDAPWGDPVTIYQEKLGYTAAAVSTPHMDAGTWLEDIIARWWADEKRHRVRKVNYGLRSREHRFAIASPDRAVPGRGLLEVKVADHPGDSWGKPNTDQIPDHYFEQVQWQAAVAGVEVVDIAVFFTRTRRREPYTVLRDQSVIDELLEYGAAFWRHVEERTPPEPVARSLRLPLKADEIEADDEITELVQMLESAQRALDLEKDAVEQFKGQLKERLAEVGGARGNGFRIHYRPNADSTVTNWEAVARAYRELIETNGLDVNLPQLRALLPRGLDGIVEDLTSTKPGARPLLVKRAKEGTRVAA